MSWLVRLLTLVAFIDVVGFLTIPVSWGGRHAVMVWLRPFLLLGLSLCLVALSAAIAMLIRHAEPIDFAPTKDPPQKDTSPVMA